MRNKVSSGILYTVLWGSGSVAVKMGIRSADPLILASIRFIGIGLLIGPVFFLNRKVRFFPSREEWKPIFIYGLLNTALTLGSFSAAQRYATAGLSMLFIGITPLMIALISSMFLSRKLSRAELSGMFIAFCGLALASVMDLSNSHIQALGIILLIVYVSAYAFSSLYFSQLKLTLRKDVFNIWQVFIGGLILFPVSLLSDQGHIYRWDLNLFGSLLWMVVALSFIANQLWLSMIQDDSISAANWLYLVPAMGYLYGYLLLDEKISSWAVGGMFMVVTGIIISKRNSNRF